MRYITAIGALVGATLLGSSAFAADLYTPAPVYEPVVAAPATNYFAGPYIGLHGGYGWGTSDQSYVDDFYNEPNCGATYNWGCAVDLEPDGAFIGAQLGWNFVFPSGLMLGVEGDYSYGKLHDSGTGCFRYFGVNCNSATEVQHEVDQMADILARVGWVWGRWMPFIAGGWGWAHGERTAFNPDTIGVTPNSDSNWHDGWVLGGGLAFAINDHWTLKGEYRYFDGSEETYGVGFADGTKVDLNINTVRFGVNYNF